MNKFSIRLLNKSSLNVPKGLKESYSNWRHFKSDSKSDGAFFAMYKEMGEYLCKISNGALKLYVFYGFASRNWTGESWHAVANVARELDVSPRTIDKWNAELEELGFIKRESAGKKTKTVFLLPLSEFVFDLTSTEQLNNWVLTDEFKEIYGRPVNVFHLVQTKKRGKKISVQHYQILVTKIKYGKLNTRHILFKTFVKDDGMIPGIEYSELRDKICMLEKHSNLASYNVDVETETWYLDDEINLGNNEELLSIVMTMVLNEVNKKTYDIFGWKANS